MESLLPLPSRYFVWSAQAAGPYSSIAAVVRPAVIFNTLYAAPPTGGAYYVAFTDEPMRLVIELGNRSDELRTLVTGGANPRGLLNISVKRDGRIVPVAMTIEDQAQEQGRGFQSMVAWSDRIPLAGGRTIQLHATAGGPFEPGLYEFDLTTTLADDEAKPVAPLGTRLPIEVRAVTPDARVEALRRRALAAYWDGELGVADRIVSQLLALSPNNVSGLTIRGDIALASGRRPDAGNEYQRAIAILQSGADTEFLRWNGSRSVPEMIEALTKKRSSLQR